MRNRRKDGKHFSLAEKKYVWEKARIVPGNDQNIWRKDVCGAWMKWSEYGNTKSRYGWEIDHIIPIALGGGDEFSNLQALQWKNNQSKGDNSPSSGYCVVR